MHGFLDWWRRPGVAAPEPIPGHWPSFLREHCAHYRRLPAALQTKFEADVQRFLATHRITGVEIEADDDLRLLVAASASILSVGWNGYTWPEVAEVLLYPDSFDNDYTIGEREIAGVAHVWGTVILSVPALRHSFKHYDAAYHVGLHEFGHLLTFERGRNIAIPVGLPSAQIKAWEGIQRRELERIGSGDSAIEISVMTETEFFPAAVEAFFQIPETVKESHRRLYRFLRRYFGQDPASWEARFRQVSQTS